MSELAEASVLPSGLKATLAHRVLMTLEGLAQALAARHVPQDHGLSSLAEASVLPSGLKATLHTAP